MKTKIREAKEKVNTYRFDVYCGLPTHPIDHITVVSDEDGLVIVHGIANGYPIKMEESIHAVEVEDFVIGVCRRLKDYPCLIDAVMKALI
jgi:hypothetical protein